MAVPLQQFVKDLEESGILAGDTLQDFLPPKSDPRDAEELARELVRQKKLTKFQAEQVWHGKAKSLLLDNYLLLEKIGAGGMGQVFKARHRRMDRIVAVKVLPASLLKNPGTVARFQREVRAAARISHPNIVTAFDAGQEGNVHFLVMEYVDGSDLSALVKKSGRLSVDKAVNCILQVATGLDAAHRNGIVHRDIKPANLLLDREGSVKILDMGLARLNADGESGQQSELTNTGTIMGTVDYMAPEQALDTKSADARADIYSLGCSLFYLLTGQAVYSGDSMMQKLLAHREQPVPSLRDHRPEVPVQIDTVFKRLVAKRIEERYQTMAEVIGDLEAALTGRVISASADSRAESHSTSFQAPGSAAMVSTDPDVLDFLNAVSPDSGVESVRTQAGAASTSKTFGRPGGGRALAAGTGSGKRPGEQLSVARKRLLAGGALVAALGLALLVWSMSGGKKREIGKQGGEPKKSITRAGQSKSESIASLGEAADTPTGGQIWPADAPRPAVAPFDAEQARKYQQAWADYLGIPAEYTNSIGMTLRLIPPGEFLMGAPPNEVEEVAKGAGDGRWHRAGPIEAPQHRVILTRPVYLGSLEVTQGQFEKVMKSNPSHFSPNGAGRDIVADRDTSRLPVEMVDWNECAEFCTNLSRQEGLDPWYMFTGQVISDAAGTGYRLPTEAEWEFACRAGTTTRFWSGNDDADFARVGWDGSGNSVPHAGGELEPNPFGLFDVHGNVWEWCHDAFDLLYFKKFSKTPAVDPAGPPFVAADRLLRSGGWGNLPVAFRSACRYPFPFNVRLSNTGFRVALTVPASPRATTPSKSQAGKSGTSGILSDPAFQKWMTRVGLMPAEKQVEAVAAKLQELNRGFDGKLTPQIENGAVTALNLMSDDVTDLAPIKSLANLRGLTCYGSSRANRLADLSPLKGMALREFRLGWSQVADLSPLRGMPLTFMECHESEVSDLSPLEGMPLLSLEVHAERVSDLTPLRNMPLRTLNCSGTDVADLSLLKEMHVTHLHIRGTRVTDLSPLAELSLVELSCDFKLERDALILRSIKTLVKINDKPAAEFWKELEAEQGTRK